MILVDSSVWIDYFRGAPTPQTERLDALLGSEPVVTADLVLAEVLQGFGSERDFDHARKLLSALDVVNLAGQDIAIKAAKNARALRALGITEIKTREAVIATCCIAGGLTLLYSDRGFDSFVRHLGLHTALPGIAGIGQA